MGPCVPPRTIRRNDAAAGTVRLKRPHFRHSRPGETVFGRSIGGEIFRLSNKVGMQGFIDICRSWKLDRFGDLAKLGQFFNAESRQRPSAVVHDTLERAGVLQTVMSAH